MEPQQLDTLPYRLKHHLRRHTLGAGSNTRGVPGAVLGACTAVLQVHEGTCINAITTAAWLGLQLAAKTTVERGLPSGRNPRDQTFTGIGSWIKYP